MPYALDSLAQTAKVRKVCIFGFVGDTSESYPVSNGDAGNARSILQGKVSTAAKHVRKNPGRAWRVKGVEEVRVVFLYLVPGTQFFAGR